MCIRQECSLYRCTRDICPYLSAALCSTQISTRNGNNKAAHEARSKQLDFSSETAQSQQLDSKLPHRSRSLSLIRCSLEGASFISRQKFVMTSAGIEDLGERRNR